jgi:hypothetical protein
MVQAIALGHIESHEAAREIVRNSTSLKTFTPQNPEQWDEAARRFERLVS